MNARTTVIIALGSVLSLAACDMQGSPKEEAKEAVEAVKQGEDIGSIGEEAGEVFDAAGKEVKDGVKKAGEKAEDAWKDAGDEVEDAVDGD